MKAAALVLAALTLAAPSLGAQETPRPNRVIWNAIFPDPMPEGVTGLSLEASSQFLRQDRRDSADGRTHANADGEDWMLVFDWAKVLGPGRLNVRLRGASRSGGFADQAFTSFHTLFSFAQGGRDSAPKYVLDYHLERDGVVVADLHRNGFYLMDTDIAYVVDFGSPAQGLRTGVTVQLPTGKREDFSGSGGTDGLLGVAGWTTWEELRFFAQAEKVFIGLPQNSPYRVVLNRRSLTRAWVGAAYQGTGPGFWAGLGLQVSVAYSETPYRTGLARVDQDGWQQHWIFTHRALPRWRFGLSEEAGTYHAPDLTVFTSYAFRK